MPVIVSRISSSTSCGRSSASSCSGCTRSTLNLPVDSNCKVCGAAVCIDCGAYTSEFTIYCSVHTKEFVRTAKKLGDAHYYSHKLKSDFFLGKNFT